MQVEPFLISSTVNVIIAQRLVRKFASDKEKYRLKKAEVDNLATHCNMERILQILREEKLLKPKETLLNIDFCRPKVSKTAGTGYKGRMGIYEVLSATQAIKELVVKKASTKDITDQAVKDGMRTMFEDGMVKAAQGLTSIEEVLRVIIE